MSSGELSLDLFGRFGIVMAGTVVGIGLVIFLIQGTPPEPEFDQGVSDYCLKIENGTVIGNMDFKNMLKSYLTGCEKPRKIEMGYTLLKEDIEDFAVEEGISSGGDPSIIYSQEFAEGQESFRGIIVGREPDRVLLREGESVTMKAEGRSVVVY